MGIYIKGMDMPKCCIHCQFFAGNGCKITRRIFPDWMNVAARPDSCPLVEVKVPHGRLADISETASYNSRYDHFDDEHMVIAQLMLDDLPVIIEAEGETMV